MVAAPVCTINLPIWLKKFIEASAAKNLMSLIQEPFHVVYPDTFEHTLLKWHQDANTIGLPLAIRFGKKANKSPAFARIVAKNAANGFDSGIDVSSAEEFQAALAAGVPGAKIVITGPTPTQELLHLALYHNALLVVSNSVDASIILHHLKRLALRRPLRVLLRLVNTSSTTRFGMSSTELISLAKYLCGTPKLIHICGLSFHCNGYDLNERVYLAHNALNIIEENHHFFPQAKIISIGGGFPTSSVDYTTWQQVLTELRPNMFINCHIPPDQYPFGSLLSGIESLIYIARAASPISSAHINLASRAQHLGITIMAEPGRALCQGAGATLFPVLSCHRRPNGEDRVTVVRGTSLSISEQWFNSEYFPDPYLIRNGAVVCSGRTTPTAVAGSTCLDGDYLSRRFISLPDTPAPGDFLVYPDTAGYQMDSTESSFHNLPIPQKYVFHSEDNTVCEDR